MFEIGSKVNEGARLLLPLPSGAYEPYIYTGYRDELLACRKTAWLGSFLNLSPVYDVWGPDVAELLNRVSVNRDYNKLKVGGSRHAILCNEDGYMLSDGVLMHMEPNHYRTYWVAPPLAYYVDVKAKEWGLDVHGAWNRDDFFIQCDGPKSLEIMEKATHKDLHHLKFARHDSCTIAGVECTIHRLGMSGCLAYEMHGPRAEFDAVYDAIYEAGKEFGIRKLGFSSYCHNHTQGSYPNQWIHFWYARAQSGQEMLDYYNSLPRDVWGHPYATDFTKFLGSAADNPVNSLVTPFDVDWDYLINWDHDFVGKEALQRIAQNPPRKAVTLVWDKEGVGEAFAEQMYNPNAFPMDDITTIGDGGDAPFVMSYVLKDGEKVGIATGRAKDFYHHAMISLAWLRHDLAVPGTEVEVLWGTSPACQTRIKATVAEMPLYNEEYRNETFDVEKIPHPVFE